MRTLGVIAAIGISAVLPAAAHWYHDHRYYNYYGGGGWNAYNGCRPGYTI